MQHLERLKTKTILLVEDEMIIRNNLASMLKFFFKEVYTAHDGYDGLDQYEKYLPDIVMTDLKMPNMGGFELISELEKRACQSYTVIVSAHTDTHLLIDAIHKGVHRYMIKPVTEDDLFATLNSYLETVDKTAPMKHKLNSEVTIDIEHNKIDNNGEVFHLNKKEKLLLKLLCQDMNRTFTYEEIEYQVWGSLPMSFSALRSVVRDLRKKVGTQFIVNISKVGYRMK